MILTFYRLTWLANHYVAKSAQAAHYGRNGFARIHSHGVGIANLARRHEYQSSRLNVF